jgi:hypothetical protein
MKALRMVGLAMVVVAMLVGFGAMTVAADGPVSYAAPVSASYIDNQPHTIQANSSALYRFDYTIGDTRPATTITLLNGNATGLTFEVWTPDMVTDMADNMPIGRANTFNVSNDSGIVQSTDLMWSGAFGASGAYYVRVINPTSAAMSAQLMISGSGVSLAPIAVTGPSASAAQPGPNTDDPNKAVALNGTSQTVPANSAMWFSFNYAVNTDTGARPVQTITLLNGSASGLSFQVYSPEILNNWWENMPIGVGSTQMVSGENGMAQSADLTWSGAFGASGTYYMRVVNDSANALPAALTIQ